MKQNTTTHTYTLGSTDTVLVVAGLQTARMAHLSADSHAGLTSTGDESEPQYPWWAGRSWSCMGSWDCQFEGCCIDIRVVEMSLQAERLEFIVS